MVGAKIELHFDYLGKIKKYPSGYFLKKGTALTDAVTGSKSLTTHAASKRFKLRCTVVTRECAVSRFRVTTFSRSTLTCWKYSHNSSAMQG